MSLDALKESFAAVVKALTPVDYFAYYPAKVVKQNADDLTLDVQPDDTRIPGMERVPIRFGTPQTTAKVQAGARVLVGFAGGNPKLPIATVWESATLIELNFGSTTDFVALAQKVLTQLNNMATTFNGHTHVLTTSTIIATVAMPGTGTAAAPISQMSPQSVAASKVKAE